MQMVLVASPGSEKTAMTNVVQSLSAAGLDSERIDDMKTMTAEACLNAIEHGCGCLSNSHYEVELRRERQEIVLRVRDYGGHFTGQAGHGAGHRRHGTIPSHSPSQIDEVMTGKRTPRGWGLVMIDALADAWSLTGDGLATELEIRLVLSQHLGGSIIG